MYLALTPSLQHSNGSSISGDPKDGVSLNVAVKPLTREMLSEEMNQSLADSLNALPTAPNEVSEVSVIHSDETNTEPKRNIGTVSIPTDSMLAETITSPTEETEHIGQVLPPGRNSHQDTPALAPITSEINLQVPTDDEYLLPATRLKRQIETTRDLIVCPGVYDGFSARIALSVGFDALYMVRQHRRAISLR